MKVLIGVDPHKASVAVAVVDEATGKLVERAAFPQDRCAGLRALQRWAPAGRKRRWAVENAGGLGQYLAGRLVATGESVVDVPPKLSARVRVLSSGNARKNDGIDALSIALAASRDGRLAAVDPEAASEALRLLSERREDLVAERTRALNRLHGLLRDLVPGGATRTLSADRAARILRGIRPQGASARLRRRLASEVLRDVRTLDRKIEDLNGRIEAEVEASGTTLTEIYGIGPILAARIIGTVANVARFPTKSHFASYSGAAPVEASSGEVVRHRLSLAGNRKLNYALHMVAVCQARSDARGGAYYRKKLAEGKSRKEALRCLKRRISDTVYKSLVADSQAPSRIAA
ncbi:MAG TPA: IS110 family transposase [Rubrobacter sp.]|nr:IS110 family transposase [Rubrobacter sp.]